MPAAIATLGLALIARNEEEHLPHLLGSIEGAFDQVALVDCGSRDRTVEVFEEWAQAQGLPLGYKLGHLEWRDDFAAARNAADELLETDWLCSADCDEHFVGVGGLREIMKCDPRGLRGYRIPSQYRIERGECVSWCAPLRLLPRGVARWMGRTMEGRFVPTAQTVFLPADAVKTVHHASAFDLHVSRIRDQGILNRWLSEEPSNPLALAIATRFAFDTQAPPPRLHAYLHRYLAAHLRSRPCDERRRAEQLAQAPMLSLLADQAVAPLIGWNREVAHEVACAR
jgi:glycosyltransferase involved in cell wall biosynthesis